MYLQVYTLYGIINYKVKQTKNKGEFKMKVRVYQAINCEGEVIKEIVTTTVSRKVTDKIASAKLKFLYGDNAVFATLKYKGIEERGL
jgi:ABC-type sulfate transport system substrate-binding protein